MKVGARDLIFISKIEGAGTASLFSDWDWKDNDYFDDDEEFDLIELSIPDSTYLAIGYNKFVVKRKIILNNKTSKNESKR